MAHEANVAGLLLALDSICAALIEAGAIDRGRLIAHLDQKLALIDQIHLPAETREPVAKLRDTLKKPG